MLRLKKKKRSNSLCYHVYKHIEHNLGSNIYGNKNCYLSIKFIIEKHTQKKKDRHNKMIEIDKNNPIFYLTVKNNAS